jgi:Tfp pilus assembly pilus retraction ATPase PilT
MTVEDPIEYELAGVGQTQVNAKIDLTFAKALRAILRQDPDVIMIGEIRDLETAQIAIQASLTGHLVLATLHTNDAPSAVTRLIDMGVEPFLLSSSLLGVLAQRLVRRSMKAIALGYRGRTGIFELLAVDDAIRAQIHRGASEAEIRETAMAAGMQLMREDGERLVREGITTPGRGHARHARLRSRAHSRQRSMAGPVSSTRTKSACRPTDLDRCRFECERGMDGQALSLGELLQGPAIDQRLGQLSLCQREPIRCAANPATKECSAPDR